VVVGFDDGGDFVRGSGLGVVSVWFGVLVCVGFGSVWFSVSILRSGAEAKITGLTSGIASSDGLSHLGPQNRRAHC
jgi:hypothetical protein